MAPPEAVQVIVYGTLTSCGPAAGVHTTVVAAKAGIAAPARRIDPSIQVFIGNFATLFNWVLSDVTLSPLPALAAERSLG